MKTWIERGAWLVASVASTERDPLAPEACGVGPWRLTHAGTREFELPRACAAAEESEDGEPERLAIEHWMRASAAGRVPAKWTRLSDAELDELLPPARLAVHAGERLAQATLVKSEERLALTVQLATLPADLSPVRERWLCALLLDALVATRLVRFTLDRPARAVRASIDLSGAPLSLQPLLLEAARDVLCASAGQLLVPLALVCDPSLRSDELFS